MQPYLIPARRPHYSVIPFCYSLSSTRDTRNSGISHLISNNSTDAVHRTIIIVAEITVFHHKHVRFPLATITPGCPSRYLPSTKTQNQNAEISLPHWFASILMVTDLAVEREPFKNIRIQHYWNPQSPASRPTHLLCQPRRQIKSVASVPRRTQRRPNSLRILLRLKSPERIRLAGKQRD